jgi:nitroreductase
MDFFDVVRARRSVRSYLPDPPAESLIRQVLEAGMLAPSAGNRQPWEFIIVRDDQELKKAIVQTTYRGNSWQNGLHQDWLLQAPVLIVVCGNVERSAARYGWEHAHKILYQDTAACIENMLLAATALGLASCWIGGYDMVALMNLLKLPPMVPPVGFLPLGYAAAQPTMPAKLEPASLIRAWM